MKNDVFKIILAAIVILCVFFVWLKFGEVSGTPPLSGESVTVPHSDISPETRDALTLLERAKKEPVPASWEVYRFVRGNVSFEYPAGLLFQEQETDHILNIYPDIEETRAFIAGTVEEQTLGMRISVHNSGTAEEMTRIPIGDAKATTAHYATTILFGEKTYVYSGQGKDRWDRILFTHEDRTYDISIAYAFPEDRARATFYTIISSFDFSDE